MKNLAPMRRQRFSSWRLAAIRAVKRRLHHREFGEELARVNLTLTRAEQLDYLDWMRDTARHHRVPREPNYSVAWLVKLEKELLQDHPDAS